MVDILKRNQRAGDCNRLIASIENVLETGNGNSNIQNYSDKNDSNVRIHCCYLTLIKFHCSISGKECNRGNITRRHYIST